jgi:hypothetical protein
MRDCRRKLAENRADVTATVSTIQKHPKINVSMQSARSVKACWRVLLMVNLHTNVLVLMIGPRNVRPAMAFSNSKSGN